MVPGPIRALKIRRYGQHGAPQAIPIRPGSLFRLMSVTWLKLLASGGPQLGPELPPVLYAVPKVA